MTLRRDGVVRLVNWGRGLPPEGHCTRFSMPEGGAGVCIADLAVVRDGDCAATELVVDVRCGDRPAHRQALVDWAATVGYRRLWMDGEVAEMTPTPGGRAQTRCSGCRVRLVDSDVSFWNFVRQHGAFPSSCCLCGADLPQWTVVRQTPQPTGDLASSTQSRRTTCR